MATAQFDFPGIQAVLDFTGTCSVGITPGTVFVRTLPASTPAGTESVGPGYGNFRFSDGVTGVTVRDCRFAPNGFRQTQSSAGRFWEFTLQDRRWRWAEAYAIDGDYNQIDGHGKLIPKSVRSPFQLACLCLDAMGELGYAVDMPAGLATAGAAFGPGDVLVSARADYLNLGQNLPATNTNPRAKWDGIPAAQALAALVEQYGRVVVYNWVGDQVSVQVLGTGAVPAPGAALSLSPGIDPPRVPAAVVARGAETRFQVRLAFRPVLRDWDDSWQTPENVSYAPVQRNQNMVVLVFAPSFILNGVVFLGADLAAAAASVNSSADPRIAGKVTAAVVYDTGVGVHTVSSVAQCVQLTAATPGYEFEVRSSGAQPVCTAGPALFGFGFAFLVPPLFAGVLPTAQLNRLQAERLAVASAYRHFQLIAVDPADRSKQGVPLPGGGRLLDRFLAVLQNSRPQQVTPRPGDEDRIDPATLQPFGAETYNGYSKDRAPALYGSLAFELTRGGMWTFRPNTDFGNTPKRSQFYTSFRVIDPERQVIELGEPAYRILGGAKALTTNGPLPAFATLGDACFLSTDLVVETGIVLLDAGTLTPVRSTFSVALANSTAPARLISVPEAQADVVGVYDAAHNLTGVTTTDLYAQNCLAQQCLATAATYQTGQSVSSTYVGIVPVALSGVTRQVSWSMSAAGFTTTVSLNSEHSTVVLPYSARRRVENLPPDALRGAQNLATVLINPKNALAGRNNGN